MKWTPQFCVLHLVFCLWSHFLLTESGVMWPVSCHCCRQNHFFIQSPGQSDILLAMVMTLGQDGQKLNYDLSPPLGEVTHMMIGRNVTNYKKQPPLYFTLIRDIRCIGMNTPHLLQPTPWQGGFGTAPGIRRNKQVLPTPTSTAHGIRKNRQVLNLFLRRSIPSTPIH